jgi:Domain of unknown function (DUF4870)
MIHLRPLEHVPESGDGLPGTRGGRDYLACLQGSLTEGGLPRPAVDVLPGRVAPHTVLAVGWTVTTLSVVIFIGFVLITIMAIVSVVPFVHAGYAAYRVSKGDEYRYPLASDIGKSR